MKNDFENLNLKILFSSPKINDDKQEETVEIYHKIYLFKNDILNLIDNFLTIFNKIQNNFNIINQDKKLFIKILIY